jgi:hypothetical protein
MKQRIFDHRSYMEDRIIRVPIAGCWLWTEYVMSNGYAQFCGPNRQKTQWHRLSWTIHNGPIPDGMQVLHKCDVRCCVNPHHLFLGTHMDNMIDRQKKGRNVNPIGEQHGQSKLTVEQVKRIKYSTERGSDLARDLSISPVTVHAIRHGKTWKHV